MELFETLKMEFGTSCLFIVVVSVAAVSEQEIRNTLETEWKDFEDAVQYSVALLNEMEGLITGNPKDYEEKDMNIWSPEQVLKEYENRRQMG